MIPCCCSSATLNAGLPSALRKVLMVAAATSLKLWACPVPRLKMPDLCGLSRKYRSEEPTSELQSQSNLVCRLLPEEQRMIALLLLHTPAGVAPSPPASAPPPP